MQIRVPALVSKGVLAVKKAWSLATKGILDLFGKVPPPPPPVFNYHKSTVLSINLPVRGVKTLHLTELINTKGVKQSKTKKRVYLIGTIEQTLILVNKLHGTAASQISIEIISRGTAKSDTQITINIKGWAQEIIVISAQIYGTVLDNIFQRHLVRGVKCSSTGVEISAHGIIKSSILTSKPIKGKIDIRKLLIALSDLIDVED
jgi:hypothetical protein